MTTPMPMPLPMPLPDSPPARPDSPPARPDSKQAFYMAQESLDELTVINDAAAGTTAGDILVASGTDFVNKTMSGDATISSTGALTIANTSVETAMLAADAVTGAKIGDDELEVRDYACC